MPTNKLALVSFSLSLILFISCGSTSVDKTSASGQSSLAKSSHIVKSTASTKGDGIVGDWQLSIETYDENGNKALDDAERKKGFSNHYFYRFNTDGNCWVSPLANNPMQNAFKGHYTITEKNNKKIITIYLDGDEEKGLQDGQYTIVSVNKDELVLLETALDHAFWIFKRV
jgi:Lipocalin-like domain